MRVVTGRFRPQMRIRQGTTSFARTGAVDSAAVAALGRVVEPLARVNRLFHRRPNLLQFSHDALQNKETLMNNSIGACE